MTPIAKVSVIVPVYNVEQYFEKCLRSLFGQTLQQIEYLFIDDRTPDKSIALLNKVLSDYPLREPYVKIIVQPQNLGQGAARKRGMEEATGEYVIHCDSDDWIEPDMYESMYNTAIQENADIVCCDRWVELTGKSIHVSYPYEKETLDMLSQCEVFMLFPALWNKLVRRQLYITHACYPFEGINMWEDRGVSVRLRYYSSKTVVLRKPFYHYNQTNSHSIGKNVTKEHIRQEMACAHYVERFFKQQGENVYNRFTLPIASLKFESKSSLLTNPNTRNLEKWKAIYPETHQFVMRYTNLSLISRLLFRIAIFNPAVGCFLFDWKRRIGNKIRHLRKVINIMQ